MTTDSFEFEPKQPLETAQRSTGTLRTASPKLIGDRRTHVVRRRESVSPVGVSRVGRHHGRR